MPRLSIIIPVYNAAGVIDRCFNSIREQTLDGLEAVFVDDHGTDDSIHRLEQLIANAPADAGKHYRITATAANGGPGAARNEGLRTATGEYVAFLDADDYVEPDAYRQLYLLACNHQADLCSGRIVCEEDGKPQEILSNPPISSDVFEGTQKRNYLVSYVSYFTSYIYRRSLLEQYDIRFPGTRSAEDSCFLGCCLLAAGRMAQTDLVFYHYVRQSQSLTTRQDPLRYQQKLRSFHHLLDFARKQRFYPPYAAELDYLYIKKAYLLSTLNYLCNTDHPERAVLQETRRLLTACVPAYRRNAYYRSDRRTRLLCTLLHRCPDLSMRLLPWVVRRFHIAT